MRRAVCCFSIAMAPLLLCGCYDRKELEQQAFVTVMGVDAAPGGMMDVTFDIAAPQASGSGSDTESKSSGPQITVRARTITEAMTTANSSVERTLTLTHLTLLLFGQEMAKRGLSDIAETVSRYRQFRGTTLVGVTEDTAAKTMAAFQPVLEKSPSRAAEGVAMVGQEEGTLPPTYLHDLLRNLQTHHVGTLLPMFAINPMVEQDPKGEQGIPEKERPSQQTGHLARAGGNPVEWGGAAVFRGGKMVDVLDDKQMQAVDILCGNARRVTLNVQDPLHPAERIGLSLRAEHPPRFHVALGSPLQVSVDVPLEGDIQTTEDSVDYSDSGARLRLQRAVDTQLGKQLQAVLQRLLMKDKADVIPVSAGIRHDFPNHQAFVQYPWEENLDRAQIRVNMDLSIRRYGVQMVPLTEK
ncbi:MAG: Ger(x)C family spore germination protein [Alicyclobacillus sp.]|nr:Ger(x)C family spore germination protein [Alicyclobacillus sp.]